jgi:hypothetical protein
MYTGNEILDCHGKSSIQQEGEILDQKIGLKCYEKSIKKATLGL